MSEPVEATAYLDVVHRTWEHATKRPDAVVLRQAGSSWSYDDLARAASRHARSCVEHGVVPGDRVLLVAPTTVGFVQAYLGVLAAGGVAVTVNPLCTARELEYYARDADCRLVIGWHENATTVAPVADLLSVPFIELGDSAPGEGGELFEPVARDADDPAVLLYTSGTTGHPKGAVISLGNVFASSWAIRRTFRIAADDRLGTALPLFHVYGQVAVLGSTLDAGASLTLLRPFNGEELLRLVERDSLTVLSGVPTMWIEMLEAARRLDPPPDVSTLRLASSGGAALPMDIIRSFADEFGADVLDGYGLSETSGIATFRPPELPPREGSVGQASPGVEIHVVDPSGNDLPVGEVGEITVAGNNVMQGYWGRPEATEEALAGGRLKTGDLGRLDEDGFLWIVGRSKELIIRGGYNVYPREVEDAVYEHPAVLEAAVIGVPDDRLGEEVAVVVAFRPGFTATPAEIRSWLDERVAAYKVPRLVHVVEALPKGATGKIQKAAIDRDALLERGVRVRRSPA